MTTRKKKEVWQVGESYKKPLSKCCHADMTVHSADEGTNFYVCTACQKPTDWEEPPKEHNKDCNHNHTPDSTFNCGCSCVPDAHVPKGEGVGKKDSTRQVLEDCVVALKQSRCCEIKTCHFHICDGTPVLNCFFYGYKPCRCGAILAKPEPPKGEKCCADCSNVGKIDGKDWGCDYPKCPCHKAEDSKVATPAEEGSWEDKEFFLELADKLEDLFPKGKCKERSQALVLNAEANMLHNAYLKIRISEREAKAYWRGSERQREIQLTLSEMRIKKAEKRVWDKANNACLEAVAQAIFSFKKEIVEKIGELNKEHENCTPTSFWDNGYKDALSAVIKLLNEPQ